MTKSKKLLSFFLALMMLLTSFPIVSFATTEVDKPADATTNSQPFVSGSPSQNYRIPAVCTLKDGTILAAADARWDQRYDGGGNDVILARSTDGGNTWKHTLLNYFGDNGNQFNTSSTTFCDSEIATDGTNVYILSTFFPAGYAINGSSSNYRPTSENAFDSSGRLLLKKSGESSYNYYLDFNDKTNNRYKIKSTSNSSVASDYTVDEEFYLYNSSGTKSGSIFYSDGAYQTAKTTFLWFRSSADGGVTWSAPSLVNVKNQGEIFLGVGPGRGLVTSTGDIVFTTYTYSSGSESQRTYLVTSDDKGKTWKRTTANATNDAWWSSEAVAIELPNGTIRVFLRSAGKKLVYSDATRDSNGNYTWKGNHQAIKVNGSEIANWSDCQESALMYPHKINGKDAILVTCPTDSTGRKNGVIHTFLLDDNYNYTNHYTYTIPGTESSFQYSSMDVMPNGDIVIVYEKDYDNPFKRIPITTIVPGAQVEEPQTNEVVISVGESFTFTSPTNALSCDSEIASITTMSACASKGQLGTSSAYNGNQVSLSNAEYYINDTGNGYTARNATGVYIAPSVNGSAYPNSTTEKKIDFEPTSTNGTFYLRQPDSNQYVLFSKGNDLSFNRWTGSLTDSQNNALGVTVRESAGMNLFRPVAAGEASGSEIPGYVKIMNKSEINSGNYLIAYKATNGSYYVMYPSTSTSDKYSHVAKVIPDTQIVYNATVKGEKPGSTTIKVSNTLTYNITVTKAPSGDEVGLCTPGYRSDNNASTRINFNTSQPASLTNALYTFEDNQDGTWTISNSRATDQTVYLNLKGDNRWCIPNQKDADKIKIQKSNYPSSTNELVTFTGSVDTLIFGRTGSGVKGDCDQMFDRVPKDQMNDNSNRHNGTGGMPLYNTAFTLYRRATPGEASSPEMQGFVKVKDPVNDIVDKGEYIIASTYRDNSLYVLYPQVPSGNGQSDNFLNGAQQVARVGTPVTGAIKYPSGVIYTQGSQESFSSFGTTIAEGTKANGDWYKTPYQLAPGWTIDHITVSDGIYLSNLNSTKVTPSSKTSNGILTGSINLAAAPGNNTETIYEKVLVDTFLKNNGKTYVQHDYLWVTTTPMPVHIISSVERWMKTSSDNATWITQSTMGLIAKGSTAIFDTNKPGSTGSISPVKFSTASGTVQNATWNKYSWEANATAPFQQNVMYFAKQEAYENATNTGAVTKDANKLAGWYAYAKAGATVSGNINGDNEATITGRTALYYYDRSSSYNPGFTVSNGSNARLDMVMNRPYYQADGDYSTPVGTSQTDFNDIHFTFNGSTKTFAADNALYNDCKKFNNFGDTADNAMQTLSSDITIPEASGEYTGEMVAKVSHNKGGGGGGDNSWAINKTVQPIKIRVDAKKVGLRTKYDNCVSTVRTADKYTPATWKAYSDAVLDATIVLNNYLVSQDLNQNYSSKETAIQNSLGSIKEVADFSELETVLEDNAELFEKELPFDENGQQQYSFDSWSSFQKNYAAADKLVNETYGDPQQRLTASKDALQSEINSKADSLTLLPPADDDAYEAVAELVSGIDIDAYKNGSNITGAVSNADNIIYEEIDGKKYIKPSKNSQTTVDDQVMAVLTATNVAGENNENNTDTSKGKNTRVTFQKNGVDTGFSTLYRYGTNLKFTVVNENDYSSNTSVNQSLSDSLVVKVTYKYDNNNETTTPISLNHIDGVKKYLTLTARCPEIVVNLVFNESATVMVRDYFDVLLYTGVASNDQIAITDNGKTLTINGQVITPKPSPAFQFVKWVKTTNDSGTIIIKQQGTRIGGVHTITATGGTVSTIDDSGNRIEGQNEYKGFNLIYTITASGNTQAWEMKVTDNDGNARTYLAGYDSTFTRFVSDYNVEYTALTEAEARNKYQSAYGKPVSYGDAYLSGDGKTNLTLSCFYALPQGFDKVNVRETGILYSTDGSLTPETMVTNATGVVKRNASNVSNYNTYTMTKLNANTGTHLMRSYISYTGQYQGNTVIFVSYGPVYKCENGVISIVD